MPKPSRQSANGPRPNLSVDLQESYRLAAKVAPFVDKIRYNPGHLYHHEKSRPVRDKVHYLADVAAENDCAMRVGVNCGSVDPAIAEKFGEDSVGAMVASAIEHVDLLEELGFTRYCVSLKDSDPAKVVDANMRFAEERPEIPLHLGVTEAGLPPDGIIKTRIAFEQLLSRGIGDTIRVSLTLPNPRKPEEVEVGHQILDDIEAGRFRSVPDFGNERPQYHLLPVLLTRRERAVRRARGKSPRPNGVRAKRMRSRSRSWVVG